MVTVIPDKPLESLAPCLIGPNGKPLVRNGAIDSQALESYLSDEELLNEDDEADMSLLPQNVIFYFMSHSNVHILEMQDCNH